MKSLKDRLVELFEGVTYLAEYPDYIDDLANDAIIITRDYLIKMFREICHNDRI